MNGAPPRAPFLAAVAHAVLARPWPAGVLAGALLVTALAGAWVAPLIVLAPLASLAGGALVAFLVLAGGVASAGPLAAGVGLALATMTAAGVHPLAGMVLVASHAGALAVLAAVWRASRSLALTLAAAALGATAVAVGGALRLDEGARAARRQTLEQWFGALAQADAASLNAALDAAVTLSGGLLGLSLLVSWVLALAMARSLQAAAVAPGAFGQEFRALRLGRGLTVLAAVVMGLAFAQGLEPPALAAQAAVVLVGLYALQGLAVLHALAAARTLWPGMLWLVYGALIVASVHAAALCALLGMVDNWVDFRTRAAARRGS